jgi:hypothetical protein
MAATGVNRGRDEMGKDGDDDVVEGPTGESRHKSHQMAATSVNRARRNMRDDNDNIDDVNSDDDIQEQEMTRRSLAMGYEGEYSVIQWMNGGRQKIWGTQRRVMTSLSLIGIIKSENEGNATTMNSYQEKN